jgi:hypothetical protein
MASQCKAVLNVGFFARCGPLKGQQMAGLCCFTAAPPHAVVKFIELEGGGSGWFGGEPSVSIGALSIRKLAYAQPGPERSLDRRLNSWWTSSSDLEGVVRVGSGANQPWTPRSAPPGRWREKQATSYAFGGRIAIASISSRKAGLARRGTCTSVEAGSACLFGK